MAQQQAVVYGEEFPLAASGGVPATTLAREALHEWLRQQFRKARKDAIAAYAAEMAGTNLDLESDLQAAAITTF